MGKFECASNVQARELVLVKPNIDTTPHSIKAL
jgi:hypothetical protein